MLTMFAQAIRVSCVRRTAIRDVSELSEESFRNRLPVVIYLLTLIVVGFFSNVIVILVYVFRSLPSATRAFVLGMAVCDLLTSVVGLPLQLATIRYAYDTYSLWPHAHSDFNDHRFAEANADKGAGAAESDCH
nr:hypothetical protein BaRGS_031623 [Batillaria attramentaria]